MFVSERVGAGDDKRFGEKTKSEITLNFFFFLLFSFCSSSSPPFYMPQSSSAQQALASLESLEQALALLIPAAESFEGGGAPRGGRQADAGAFFLSREF